MPTNKVKLKDAAGNVLHPQTEVALVEGLEERLAQFGTTVDAMRFRGTLGTGGTVTALPASGLVGDTYKVITAGTYAGHVAEVGDTFVRAGTGSGTADWLVLQGNVDGAVTAKDALPLGALLTGGGGQTVQALSSTIGGTTTPVYINAGKPAALPYTIQASVPAGAKFTDTTYAAATTSADGLLTKEGKQQLDKAARILSGPLGVEVIGFNSINPATSISVVQQGITTPGGTFVYFPNIGPFGQPLEDSDNGLSRNGALLYYVGGKYYSAASTPAPGSSASAFSSFVLDGRAVLLVEFSGTGSSATPTGNVYARDVATGGLVQIQQPPEAFSLPTATASTLGGVKVGYTRSGNNYKVDISAGNLYAVVPPATTALPGTLSAADKQKIDGMILYDVIS